MLYFGPALCHALWLHFYIDQAEKCEQNVGDAECKKTPVKSGAQFDSNKYYADCQEKSHRNNPGELNQEVLLSPGYPGNN